MDNKEWICNLLKEMVEGFEIEITDEMFDVIREYSKDISNGISEGYYYSSDYVADCNAKESEKSNEKREIDLLKNELNALYSAIKTKGYSFYYNGNCVRETGMEHIGGTVSASYDRPVK